MRDGQRALRRIRARSVSTLVCLAIVVAAGWVSPIGALTLAGTPQYMDSGYGSGGIATVSSGASIDDRVGAIAVDGEDRAIVAASTGPLYNRVVTVSRLNALGALDTSFGAGGLRAVPSAAGWSEALSVLVRSNGSIVVGGMVLGGQFYVARLTGSGEIDPTFGTGGSVVEPYTSEIGRAGTLAEGSDGKIIVAGSSPTNTSGYVARLTSAGAFDPTFSGDGRLPVPGLPVGGVAVQPDGKIVVVGGDFRVMRFNADGTTDSTFGNGGTANVPLQLFATGTTDVVRTDDGSFLVAGWVIGNLGDNDYKVIRVTADGELDTSFGAEGAQYVDFGDLAASGPGSGDQASSLHLLPDGRFVVAGATAGDDSAARFLPDGQLDPSFGGDGRVDFGGPRFGQHNTACCSAIQSDGSLLLASTSDANSAYYHVAVVRVLGGTMGAAWRFEMVDGPGRATGGIPADVGTGASGGVFEGQPHVFYSDATNGDLRHAWYAGGWRAETLDGASNGPSGRVESDVGSFTSTLVYGGQLQVFYYDRSHGALRHAWWDGARWNFETLDGAVDAVAAAHLTDDVGVGPATSSYGIQVHAYYRDVTHGDLRHAWWNGARWGTETLDGAATGASGSVNADVGDHVSVALFENAPHAWYRDSTGGDLRHAWWTGAHWRFETLDGSATEPSTGRVDRDVGDAATTVLYGGSPHVWYHDSTGGDLRHAWWTGALWRFETVDGQGGIHGQVLADVGVDAAAGLFEGLPHVWYHDTNNGDLRHAWWTGTHWSTAALDGLTGPSGRVNDELGFDISVLNIGAQIHAFYYDLTVGDLRHAWFG